MADRKVILIQLLREGDEKAFEELYYLYVGRIRAFLGKLNLKDSSDDVLQETFVTLWNKRASIDPDRSLDNYLFTVAKNYALKALDSKVRLDLDQVVVKEALMEEELLPGELDLGRLQRLRAAIEKLPNRPREIIKLRWYGGLSIEEIAQQSGLSKSTVENHMNRALSALRKDLSSPSLSLLILSLLQLHP